MKEGEIRQQPRAYEAAAEAKAAQEASKARAKEKADRIPDEHITKAAKVLTASLVDRFERLLEADPANPADIDLHTSQRAVSHSIGGAVMRISKLSHNRFSDHADQSTYSLDVQHQTPGNLAADIGGSHLGGLTTTNAGENFESYSADHARQRLAAALELAENMEVVERAAGFDAPPAPATQEAGQDHAWLQELLSAEPAPAAD